MNRKIKEPTVNDIVEVLDWLKKIYQFDYRFNYQDLKELGYTPMAHKEYKYNEYIITITW